MNKKTKKNLLKNLNEVSGGIVIISGVLLLFFNLIDFTSEFALSHIRVMISGIALIFLGIYVLRIEKWAIRLSGIVGVVLLINGSLSLGLFSSFRTAIFDIAYIILILNWDFNLK